MYSKFFIFVATTGLLISTFFPLTTGHAAGIETIAGQWQLNRELSDDVQAKVTAAIGGGLLANLKRNRVESALQQFTSSASELTIRTQPAQVAINGLGQPVRTLKTDGQPQQFVSPKGKQATTTTVWRNKQLVITGVTNEGTKMMQTFARVAGKNQLAMTVQINDKHLAAPLVLRFVYDEQQKGK